MEPATKLISVRGIRRMDDCKNMPRQFVDYLRDLGVVTGVQTPIVIRKVWKYTPREAAVIQSVWYFKEKGFAINKAIELAQKSQERRDSKQKEQNLFTDLAP